MKILQVCHKIPYPPRDGGSIAMNNITEGLINLGCQVKILGMNTPKNSIHITHLPDEYRKKTRIDSVYVNTSINIIDAFLNLFSKESYNIQRFISKEFNDKLIEILRNEEFDIVLMESLFLTPYLPTIKEHSKGKLILRAHNVEFEIWERQMNNCNNPIKKAYLKLLTNRLKKFEQEQFNQFDGIAAITERDGRKMQRLGCKTPINIVPIGVNIDQTQNQLKKGAKKSDLSLFHLGSMDWKPNQEAIEWLLSKVWTKIHHKFPSFKLHLAGNNMPEWIIKRTDKNIHVDGYVKDPMEYMASKDIMLVPLLSGSGMRVKIIEGMAIGKTIISTSIGAEGINYTHKKNILIANTADQFIECIDLCANDNEIRNNIGENAMDLVKNQYDNQIIVKNLLDFFQELPK